MSASAESEVARVTRIIRDDILDGVRVPGSRLVERELAGELGVSRVPVREALKALVGEGLVTPRPRTWAVVREFTQQDIADLNEVRAAIETLAFRLPAERLTDGGAARLRRVLDAELAAARSGDAVTARRVGADFHEAVVAESGNQLIAELEQELRSRMRWLLGRHDDLVRIAEEHEGLYDAIVARDVELLDRLMREHMATSRYLQGLYRGDAD